MDRQKSHNQFKPRELRRRVVLPARMRASSGWSDACILNISSRGLLIHSTRGAAQGSTIELWHGDHVIVAKVVWRNGTRVGVRADERVPVEDIMTSSAAPAPQPVAADGKPVERRKRPRTHEQNRYRGRAIEFAAAVAVAVPLAIGAFALVEQALAQPLASVGAALDG